MPAMQGVQASPNQGLEYVFPLEREPAGGGGGAAPPAQAVPASEPEHFALEEALHRIQLAHTDMEVFKVVNSLAVALGARRTEMGTVKALHAVLLQLVRPGISNAEACNATGASTSNFSKWRRQVQTANPNPSPNPNPDPNPNPHPHPHPHPKQARFSRVLQAIRAHWTAQRGEEVGEEVGGDVGEEGGEEVGGDVGGEPRQCTET